MHSVPGAAAVSSPAAAFPSTSVVLLAGPLPIRVFTIFLEVKSADHQFVIAKLIIAVRAIVFLTIMHQIMGMMAAEAAVRALRGPLVVATSCTEALLLAGLHTRGEMLSGTLVHVSLSDNHEDGVC